MMHPKKEKFEYEDTKTIIEKAKLGTHYSKNGIIIRYTSEVMWF